MLADGDPLSSLFSSNPRIATGLITARLQDRFGVVGFFGEIRCRRHPGVGTGHYPKYNRCEPEVGFPGTLGNIPPVSPRPRKPHRSVANYGISDRLFATRCFKKPHSLPLLGTARLLLERAARLQTVGRMGAGEPTPVTHRPQLNPGRDPLRDRKCFCLPKRPCAEAQKWGGSIHSAPVAGI